jgi:formamidopyrimidine-DNA glycosylase
MPELPEITVLADQMKAALVGKTFAAIEVLQAKCLNVAPEAFVAALNGARLLDVIPRGKWVLVRTSQGWLLLCLGMGGEILLVTRDTLPEKRRLIFDFDDSTCLAVNFWWFGYAHYAPDPAKHTMVGKLGPHALDLSLDEFRALLKGRRGAIKPFLLDQHRIAGIGNVYIQDSLFRAKIHPLRPIASLSDDEVAGLWQAIRGVLQESIAAGGLAFELDMYGQKGRWWDSSFLTTFRDGKPGKPCPVCGSATETIRVGNTASYICPHCQPFDV